jgi:5'-nucleotidase / UDP-sugar diphosphatase
MRTSLFVLAILMLLPAAASAEDRVEQGLPLTDPAPSGESGLKARIFFTSNQLGEFEPCACPDLPLGGVGQAAGVVDRSRDAGQPVFWFDAGDRLFRHDMAMTGTEEAERKLKAILLVDAGSVGGLDAMGVGRLDLGGGLDYLRALARRADFPVISANLVDPQGEPIFATSVVLQRGDLTVGVTSVLPGDMSSLQFSTTDPVAAAREQVAQLRAQGAQLVVVLSNLGLKDDKRLAKASKADAVLGSRSRELTTEGIAVGRAVIGQAGSRGRYLGDLRWYGDGPGKSPHLVLTASPVIAAGPSHVGVKQLVEQVLQRLADPVLGVPPLEFESWDDPEFRERQKR